MKTEVQKLAGLTEDIRLEENQREFLKRWVKHLRTYKTEEQIVDLAYTIRELGLFVKKPYESVSPEELDSYLGFKLKNEESITGNRVLNLRKSSILCYRYRINSFYRWAIKHTSLSINQELAYPRPKIVKKIEKSREQQCKDRVLVLLDNKVIDTNRKEDRSLDENNLLILNDFYNYKITSGKVESHTGFISKLCFLKRLGLYLKKRTKSYKEATREDIQGFLSEIQKSLVDKKE